jgi:hypothetical protein
MLRGGRSGRPRGPSTAGCLFCGRPWQRGRVSRSDEHIWPQWICEHAGELPDSRLSHAAGFRTSSSGGSFVELPTETTTNKASILHIKTREVCSECNSGWMSLLEVRARPVILAVAEAATDNRPVSLGTADARTLATWVEKTTITNELMSAMPRVASTSMGQRLRQDDTLRGCLVWIARHPADFGLSIASAHVEIGAAPKPVPGETDRHAMLTAITYHYVTFLAFITDSPGLLPPPVDLARWCLLWPVTGDVDFPPSVPADAADLRRMLLDHRRWLPLSELDTFHRSPFPPQLRQRN